MNPSFEFHSFKESSKLSSQIIFTVFWISSVSFALCLFLFGFFPMKAISGEFAMTADIPTEILDTRLDNNNLYRRRVGRLVFVLIDAFRWDFSEIPEHMPYITKLRRSNQATVLTGRCHPPTATMPRVKALMTGSIPNYIDVILNLGSNIVKEDNLIHQAVKNDQKVVFYGDEVWLDLFPDKFLRQEGTTSFFVSDYTEVDLNVTRNIANEMVENDWDILILHYLGLDHIGHLTGPSSPLVPVKLKEMDAVIASLHQNLQQWDLEHPQEPSYLVVVGDHGMHDSGSHGGATLGEILVSLIMIENAANNNSFSGRPEVSQVDIAATLAVLLGLPIPKSSLGVLIPYALGRLTHEEYLFALLYNTHQVADQFVMAHPDGRSDDSFSLFMEAQKVHLSWLESKSDVLRQRAESLYFSAAREMSSYLVKNLVAFDIKALVISCLILLQVFFCLLIARSVSHSKNFWSKGTRITHTFFIGAASSLCFVLFSGLNNTLFSPSEIYICVIVFAVFIALLLFWNLLVFLDFYPDLNYENFSLSSILLCVGSVLHMVSLSSSSLIEEEHQTWYFLWVTLMLLIFISISFEESKLYLQYLVLSVLFGHRILRKLNQTGDKWAHLPDIAGWLEQPEHKVSLSSLFLMGLYGVWISLYKLKCITNVIDKTLYSLALTWVLLYRCSVGEITSPFGISRGARPVQCFWVTCALIFVNSLRTSKKRSSFQEVVKVFLSVWVLCSTLLLRPCNVILIPYIILSSSTLNLTLKNPVDSNISSMWLGYVVFFYQGNSNSLSTVDVASGYIGAEHQDMLAAGLLVFIHTYCFPVLATLLQWLSTANHSHVLKRRHYLITNLQVTFLQRLLPLSFYCVLVFCQRNHLFIWSVFAPKLLYEAVLSVATFLLVVVGSVLLLYCDI